MWIPLNFNSISLPYIKIWIAILHPVCYLISNSGTKLETKQNSQFSSEWRTTLHTTWQNILLGCLRCHKDYFVSLICFFYVWAKGKSHKSGVSMRSTIHLHYKPQSCHLEGNTALIDFQVKGSLSHESVNGFQRVILLLLQCGWKSANLALTSTQKEEHGPWERLFSFSLLLMSPLSMIWFIFLLSDWWHKAKTV